MILNIKQIQEIESLMLQEIIRICKKHQIDFYLAYGSVLGAVRHKDIIPWDSDIDILVPYESMKQFIKVIKEEINENFMLYDFVQDKGHVTLFPRIGIKELGPSVLHIDVFPLIGAYPTRKEQLKVFSKLDRYSRLAYFKNLNVKKKSKYLVKRVYLKMLQLALFWLRKEQLMRKIDNICLKYPLKDSKESMTVFGCYGEKNIIPTWVFRKPVWMEFRDYLAPVPSDYDAYLTNYYKDYMKHPSKEIQEEGLRKTVVVEDGIIEKLLKRGTQ